MSGLCLNEGEFGFASGQQVPIGDVQAIELHPDHRGGRAVAQVECCQVALPSGLDGRSPGVRFGDEEYIGNQAHGPVFGVLVRVFDGLQDVSGYRISIEPRGERV